MAKYTLFIHWLLHSREMALQIFSSVSNIQHNPFNFKQLINPPKFVGAVQRLNDSLTPTPSLVATKRKVNLTIISLILNGFLPISILAQELELESYTDAKEGFTLLKPSSYVKVDKAGATVLFEEVNKGSNNVGVVVSPVRLNRLGEFGTSQFVADKLIQAERRKESTKEAEVIGIAERHGRGGLEVYEFEYKIDSSRGGQKRVFSAAFVASKKLYLLNITHSDKPETPLDNHTRLILEKVLHSFDVAPIT